MKELQPRLDRISDVMTSETQQTWQQMSRDLDKMTAIMKKTTHSAYQKTSRDLDEFQQDVQVWRHFCPVPEKFSLDRTKVTRENSAVNWWQRSTVYTQGSGKLWASKTPFFYSASCVTALDTDTSRFIRKKYEVKILSCRWALDKAGRLTHQRSRFFMISIGPWIHWEFRFGFSRIHLWCWDEPLGEAGDEPEVEPPSPARI